VAPLIARMILSVALLTQAATVRRQDSTELNFIPFVGGDSDVGIGIGGVGDLAGLRPHYDPFRWRLEGAAFVSFKPEGSTFKVPFQDYYLLLAVPRLLASGRLRLEIRPSFTDESTQRYFGVGNASPRPDPALPITLAEYERRHAALAAAVRWTLGDGWFLRNQVDYAQNWVHVGADTILAHDRLLGSPDVRALLAGPLDHGVAAMEVRLEYDRRDNEIVTRNGSYHHLQLRFSPRLGDGVPFQFSEMDVTLRAYRTPVPWLTLSGRLVADVLVGHPPFYDLTRIDDSSVVGGGKGIRGVPGQRYYGKDKLFGNLEGRVQVLRFAVRGKPFILSTALFADGGRVWSDLGGHPELDGTGLGLKYGLGGGLRLQEGTTFIVRADVAWSPDARPIGAYFNAGEMF
jgi:hypothetical protein